MEVLCLQENLNKALQVVGRSVGEKTHMPITECVLMESEKDQLKLTCTDLKTTTSCWIPAEVTSDGKVAISEKLISALVEQMPTDVLHLKLLKTSLTIECNNSKKRLTIADSSLFPPIINVTGVKTKIDAKEFKLALSQVVFAAAQEQSRPVLTGVHAEFSDMIQLIAADGYRLSFRSLPILEPISEKVLVIPAQALSELSKILTDGEVELIIGSGQVLFKFKNIEMIIYTLAGEYPLVHGLIPDRYDTRAVVNTQDLLRAIKISSVVAKLGGGNLFLEITKTGVLLSADEEVGDTSDEIEAVVEGKPIKLIFDSRYLIEGISAQNLEYIAVEVASVNGNNTGVFRPVGNSDYIYVVMPKSA